MTRNKLLKYGYVFLCAIGLTSCGFHLQGELKLAPPLQHLYLQTPDPYGYLARNLITSLKLSHVQLAASPAEASTILIISQDEATQDLLSVSGTQQTRQYNLRVTVTFEITNTTGRLLVGPQTLAEARTITVQSNQVLASSNETNAFYQQMRRSLAYEIMNRIASKEVSQTMITAFPTPVQKKQ